MRTRRLVPALLGALAAAACQKPAQPAAETPQAAAPAAAAPASLYQRLGGYDALAGVTDDFLARMLGDPKMAPYFETVDEKGKKQLRQMLVDQLCAATGGPCIYVGADMPTAHKDLHISDKAFDVAAQYLGETLDKFKVPEKEKGEVLSYVSSTRKEIVGK
jgi:hemoglobin